MPLKRCSKNGKSGWKWGNHGACYTGKDGKKKAIKQGIAIEGPEKFAQIASTEEFNEAIMTYQDDCLMQRLMQIELIYAKKMTRKSINDLPDSDFAYIESGGKKDKEGKTVPRSLRHFPIHDAAHVRNALARLPQSKLPEAAKKAALTKIKKAAKKFGIEVSE